VGRLQARSAPADRIAPSSRPAALGPFIGDGKLNYSEEKILEAYYAYKIDKSKTLTFDYQFFLDPAHNADRGRFGIRRATARAVLISTERHPGRGRAAAASPRPVTRGSPRARGPGAQLRSTTGRPADRWRFGISARAAGGRGTRAAWPRAR